MRASLRRSFLLLFLAGCTTPVEMPIDSGLEPPDAPRSDAFVVPSDTGVDAPITVADTGIDAPLVTRDSGPCGTPAECAAAWEQNASDRMDGLLGDPAGLAAFLRAVPKGGDLHNHLTGAVYAETFLDWADADGDCIVTATTEAVSRTNCDATTMPVPMSGTPFFTQIVQAWSMEGFVPSGTESGHDHFFATFSNKFGLVAGQHHNEEVADIATRAASENQLYVETMLNAGTRVGTLAAGLFSGTVTPASLPGFYDTVRSDPGFANAVMRDAASITSLASAYRTALGCSGATPPAACNVQVRFVAQVSRTGNNDQIFGQLISAYEMAAMTNQLVAVNLSSAEDDTRSINNYALHMQMLSFLHDHYTTPGLSPLHVTLHAGELVPMYLPTGSTANTFHIRDAVEIAHAERIGHGIDVLSETNSSALLDEMASRGVLVEVCLSSNTQILEVDGTDHPLAQYIAHHVPVALATDDQGVSRSSMAGEYLRAVQDQHLDYRQLKAMARDSLEHSFLPGASLWTSLSPPTMVAACAPVMSPPSAACQTLLSASERASIQYALEQRFLAFESAQ